MDPPSTEVGFCLETMSLTYEQIKKFRKFLPIDAENPQDNPPGVHHWLTPNQQVTVKGTTKTATKFSILMYVGSDPDVLLLYSNTHAKLERDGFGLSVPVPSMVPDYFRFKDHIVEFATAVSFGDEDDLDEAQEAILAQDKGAWTSAVSAMLCLIWYDEHY